MNVIKYIFKLQGFESIYQSKIVGKHKGSGLAIYIKEAFLFTKLDAFSQCSSNLESLFISINNTENPITVGVLYRPPSGDTTLFISELNSILQKLPLTNVYLSTLISTYLKTQLFNSKILYMAMDLPHLSQLLHISNQVVIHLVLTTYLRTPLTQLLHLVYAQLYPTTIVPFSA